MYEPLPAMLAYPVLSKPSGSEPADGCLGVCLSLSLSKSMKEKRKTLKKHCNYILVRSHLSCLLWGLLYTKEREEVYTDFFGNKYLVKIFLKSRSPGGVGGEALHLQRRARLVGRCSPALRSFLISAGFHLCPLLPNTQVRSALTP